ncbi:hypothetical protein GF342_06020 [Candidatus Woesearchaeota archaeon]|nr:hypothetical protein [Candidatus Woesearchaeota archaeon]
MIQEQFQQLLRQLTLKDRIGILHDFDPDGICSAAVMADLVERASKAKVVAHDILDRKIELKRFTQFIQDHQLTLLITMDVSTDMAPEVLNALSIPVLVIDHHPLYEGPFRSDVLIIKPQLLFEQVDAAKYSTSYLVNYLSEGLADISNDDWKIATGVIADIGYELHKDYVDHVFAALGIEVQADIFDTLLGQLAILINNSVIYDIHNAHVAFTLLRQAKKPQELFTSSLAADSAAIQSAIETYVGQVKQKATYFADVIYYHIDSNYNIKKPISTILSLAHPHNTIITYSTVGNLIHVSARRGDGKVPLDKILAQAIKNIEGAFSGGHPVSSGARIPKDKYHIFEKRLIHLLKTYKGS